VRGGFCGLRAKDMLGAVAWFVVMLAVGAMEQ